MNDPTQDSSSSSSSSPSAFISALGNNPGLSLIVIIGLIPLLAILYWGLGELLFLLFGVNVLPRPVIGNFRRREDEGQQRTTTTQPSRPETGLSDELEWIRQEELEAQKRLEGLQQARSEKYKKFLEPYCKVIQESDIYYGYEKPIPGTNKTTPLELKADYSDEENKSSSTSLKGEEDDIEIPQYPRRITDCGTIDSKPPSWIKVVSSLHQSSSYDDIRYVEGNCSICLLEYEVGDIFISSTRRTCIHGFHQDCALTWLSTGKKRCPMCRNYFVPRSRIDDVDVVHHRDDDMEAYRIHHPTSSLYDNDPLQQAITFEGLVLDDDDQDREDPLRTSQISSVLSTSMDHVIDRLDQSVSSDGTRRSVRGRTYCQIHPL